MADEKLNTGPAENISPEAAEPIATPEQAAASEPQQEQTGPAIPEPGDVVVSFDKINELNKIWNGYSLGSLRNCYENKCHNPCDCCRNLARDTADYRFQLWSKAISSGTGGLHACNKVESCCFHYCFYRISIFPAIYHFTIKGLVAGYGTDGQCQSDCCGQNDNSDNVAHHIWKRVLIAPPRVFCKRIFTKWS